LRWDKKKSPKIRQKARVGKGKKMMLPSIQESKIARYGLSALGALALLALDLFQAARFTSNNDSWDMPYKKKAYPTVVICKRLRGDIRRLQGGHVSDAKYWLSSHKKNMSFSAVNGGL